MPKVKLGSRSVARSKTVETEIGEFAANEVRVHFSFLYSFATP